MRLQAGEKALRLSTKARYGTSIGYYDGTAYGATRHHSQDLRSDEAAARAVAATGVLGGVCIAITREKVKYRVGGRTLFKAAHGPELYALPESGEHAELDWRLFIEGLYCTAVLLRSVTNCTAILLHCDSTCLPAARRGPHAPSRAQPSLSLPPHRAGRARMSAHPLRGAQGNNTSSARRRGASATTRC